jgi:beta-mannosidase
LCFEGLDTYAEITLNGKKILDCANMFRTYRAEVKSYLVKGKNKLNIHFNSSIKKTKELASKLTYTLPGEERVFARKAQFQFGWDFGPRMVGCGIWKNVKLISYNKARIQQYTISTRDFNDSLATLACRCDIYSPAKGDYSLFLSCEGEKLIADTKTLLDAGMNTVELTYKIKRPKLWWCNGMGEQNLYNFTVSLRNNVELDKKQSSVGIRKIEWVKEKVRSETSFYLQLNGIPVFMKGANYIPQNVIHPLSDEKKNKDLLATCKNSGMNMLRIWGGGIYETENFYSECDKNGILVWQDLMFACAMYPGDTAFFRNVKIEVNENITRISNHPCLALVCGNNENDEGWKNWGWQKQYHYSFGDSSKIAADYFKLFHLLVPPELNKIDPRIPYHLTSPTYGWGKPESLLSGDSHYWGVWWGKEPFEMYRKKTGKFMSEYGMQALPDHTTLASFCDAKDLNLNSSSLRSHQKNKTGFETINHYMEMYYGKTDSLDRYIYLSQLLQRDALKIAIEQHRISKPDCMGTLFWQLNDCWPGISWSVIDHKEKPKAAMYALKDLYATILPIVQERDSVFYFRLVNDSTKTIEGDFLIKINDLEGKLLLERKGRFTLEGGIVSTQFGLEKKWLKEYDAGKTYMTFEFRSGNIHKKVFYYFKKPKELSLPKANVEFVYDPSKNTISLTATTFVKDLCISSNADVTFSENFFDMEKGEKKEVKVIGKLKDKRGIKILSLN